MSGIRFMAVCGVMIFAASMLIGEAVVTLDARTVEGTVTGLDAKGVRITAAGSSAARAIALRDISEVSLGTAENLLARKGQVVVGTNVGDWILVENLRLAAGKFQFTCPGVGDGDMTMDMNAVKVLLLPAADQTPQSVLDDCVEKKYSRGSQDLLVIVGKKGNWRSAKGVLKDVGKGKITFRYRDSDRKISRDSVRAIWLSELARPKAAIIGEVVCRNGMTLHFTSVKMGTRAAAVESPALGKLGIPRKSIAAVRFSSTRLVNLADLKPTKVTEHGFFNTKFPFRRNRSAGGGPLKLGGKTYRTGLGLHSFCELTYDLGGKFATFVATAGIDDAVRPGGNATLTILADGKELLKPAAMTGKQAPKLLRLNVKGVKTLVIRVGFGSDSLDVADHVNLADVRLVKNVPGN